MASNRSSDEAGSGRPVLRLPGRCVGLKPDGLPCEQQTAWAVCALHASEFDELQRQAVESSSRCHATASKGAGCERPAVEMGLCQLHLDSLEARLLASLLNRSCHEMTASGRPCSGELTDLCATHRDQVARRFVGALVTSEIGAAAPRRRAAERAPVPAPQSAEEARDRLNEILARRRFVPRDDEAYTIPFEELYLERRIAYGPSLVIGDEPVSFYSFEKSGGRIVASYGVNGSKAGCDMPLASRRLFTEIAALLKHLPGYTETCELTGEPIHQHLATIAYKLLRGLITVEQVRFARFTPEAVRSLGQSDAMAQVYERRRLVRQTPIEIARALLEAGAPRRLAERVFRRMVPATEEELHEAFAAAEHQEEGPASEIGFCGVSSGSGRIPAAWLQPCSSASQSSADDRP